MPDQYLGLIPKKHIYEFLFVAILKYSKTFKTCLTSQLHSHTKMFLTQLKKTIKCLLNAFRAISFTLLHLCNCIVTASLNISSPHSESFHWLSDIQGINSTPLSVMPRLYITLSIYTYVVQPTNNASIIPLLCIISFFHSDLHTFFPTASELVILYINHSFSKFFIKA